MILHPNILEQDGKKAFAILPYDEFVQIKSDLEDYEDLKYLRSAKAEESEVSAIDLSTFRKENNI